MKKCKTKGLSVWEWLDGRRIYYFNNQYSYLEQAYRFDGDLDLSSFDQSPLPIETHPYYLKPWDELHMSGVEKSFIKTRHDKDLKKQ